MENRRQFLADLARAAAAAGLNVFANVSVAGALYRNERIGLRLRRPNRWEFESIADFAALRAKQVLADAEIGEDHPLRDSTNLPVFIFSDAREAEGHFRPAVTLYDETLYGGVPRDQCRGHEWMLEGFSESYKDLAIATKPWKVSLKGTPATIAEWSYIHQIDDGSEIPLWIRSILVFRRERVHTWYLVDSRDKRRVSARVWERFVDSIEYDRLTI